LKIEKTLLDDHQIQLNVEVDDETFEKSKQRAARRISKNHKVPGFRPGKAPYHVIVRQFGEGAVIEDAIEFLVDDIYPQLIDQEEITPYGPGSLKEVKSLDPPALEFVIPLAPSVDLGEYAAIRKPFELPEVTDDDVDLAIENLLERQAKSEIVERPAEVGDRVYVTLHGHEKDDEKKKLVVDLHGTPVVIEPEDADTEKEWPVPGFSHSLTGLQQGDTKDFEHTFPEDYEKDEALKGKAIEFHVTIESVRTRELPELDDEFAKSVGEYESVTSHKVRQNGNL
jgi:trigger factor